MRDRTTLPIEGNCCEKIPGSAERTNEQCSHRENRLFRLFGSPGGQLDLIEVRLMSVGGGPTLDFESATAFLAGSEPLIERARRRMPQ